MDPARPLLEIQEHDTAIDRLLTRIEALESGGDVAAALAEANEAERVMGELRLQLDELSRDQLRFEHEIDSMSQKAAAEERRMYDGSVANARGRVATSRRRRGRTRPRSRPPRASLHAPSRTA